MAKARVRLTWYGDHRVKQATAITGQTEKMPTVGEPFSVTDENGILGLVHTRTVANVEQIGKEYRFQSDDKNSYGLEVLAPK
jgi:hypothetical protein